MRSTVVCVFGLALAIGCDGGAKSDKASPEGIAKAKDAAEKMKEKSKEMVGMQKEQLQNMMSENLKSLDKMIEDFKAKAATATGDSKAAAEKMHAKLTELRGTFSKNIESFKSATGDGASKMLESLPKSWEEISTTMKEGKEWLEKQTEKK